jgi:hypothetical protein
MQRRQVFTAVLGLMLAATAARADIPKEVTILGQKYTLDVHSLGGKYANGQTIVLPPEDDKTTTIGYGLGAAPEQEPVVRRHDPSGHG